jgi:hypothetical protein
MTSTDFIYWMRGFVTACPHFHPTPEQWQILTDTLSKVKTKEHSEYTWPASIEADNSADVSTTSNAKLSYSNFHTITV